jgi:hypothetical protein
VAFPARHIPRLFVLPCNSFMHSSLLFNT